MDLVSFNRRMQGALPAGTVIDNPGRGTTTVMWINDDRLCYQRGRGRFYVSVRDLHAAYMQFLGGEVTTSALKLYAPEVFDSGAKGHNCNCTVLFMALQRMGLAGPIIGRGRKGDPFATMITHGS
jgi:hypothetical protein